ADIEAQAHTRRASPGVGLIELLEYAIAMLGSNPQAVVADGDTHGLFLVGRFHLNRTAVRAELDRVVDQVDDDLLDPQRIDHGVDSWGCAEHDRVFRTLHPRVIDDRF